MELPRVVAFTDSYLPTVNGVTYTIRLWRERYRAAGGRMELVYPASSHTPGDGEYPTASLPVPFYPGIRLGLPRIPNGIRESDSDSTPGQSRGNGGQSGVETDGAGAQSDPKDSAGEHSDPGAEDQSDPDVVHAHTPFGLGLAGYRFAKRRSLPLVVSYHTPTPEYAGYLADSRRFENTVGTLARRYERWFLEQAAEVIVPSEHAANRLQSITDPIVISNGVDTTRFRPVADSAVERLREQLGVPDGPVVGYTGRHGHEKDLETAIDAVAALDREVTVVCSGDGPAREKLKAKAAQADLRAVFPGFLDRGTLPTLYSLFDVFVFPSPVETQGLVALESIACGTPVVGARAGALPEMIEEGVTGYTAPAGDVVAFTATVADALDDADELSAGCLSRREALDVRHSIENLRGVYERVSGV